MISFDKEITHKSIKQGRHTCFSLGEGLKKVMRSVKDPILLLFKGFVALKIVKIRDQFPIA